MITIEPIALNQSEIASIVKSSSDVKYVCDHDMRTMNCYSIFYSNSTSLYYAVHRNSLNNALYTVQKVHDFEKFTIHAVEAHDGEIIYSRFPLDYRESRDQTVWVDGGCTTTLSVMNPNQRILLIFKDGVIFKSGEHW